MLSVLAGIVSVFDELLVFDYHSSNQLIKQHGQIPSRNKLHTSISYEPLYVTSITHNQPLSETAVVKSNTNDSNQISLENLLTLDNIDLNLNLNPVRAHSDIADTLETVQCTPVLRTASINKTKCEHSSVIEEKNEREKTDETHISMAQGLHLTKQDVNNNDDSTCTHGSLLIKSSSFKKIKHSQMDFCAFEGQSKKPHIHKLSKQKHISTNVNNSTQSCCLIQLFHPKSIVHIHDEEHRLFSIATLRTPQNDEELLTQRTKQCVDQIFDFLMYNHLSNTTNDSCQFELILPLYTQSQLDKIK